MSDTMFYGVLRMPYEMAMEGDISRLQFYDRVQECANRCESAEAEVARLTQALADKDLQVMEAQELSQRAVRDVSDLYERQRQDGNEIARLGEQLQAANRQAEKALASMPPGSITEQKCKVRINVFSGTVRGVFLESYPYDVELKSEKWVDAVAYGAAPQQHAQAALSGDVMRAAPQPAVEAVVPCSSWLELREKFEAIIRERHPSEVLAPHPKNPYWYALDWVHKEWLDFTSTAIGQSKEGSAPVATAVPDAETCHQILSSMTSKVTKWAESVDLSNGEPSEAEISKKLMEFILADIHALAASQDSERDAALKFPTAQVAGVLKVGVESIQVIFDSTHLRDEAFKSIDLKAIEDAAYKRI